MANLGFYLVSCALMLTLSWRASTALPVRAPGEEQRAQCPRLFQTLLENLTGLLKSDVLCFGITTDRVAITSTASTVQACAPNLIESSGCTIQRNSSFSESECVTNIMKDLAHYDAAIQSYLSSTLRSPQEEVALLSPTLEIIRRLRRTCSLTPEEGDNSSEEDTAQMWGDDTYNNRQEMCKMMRGFHIRTITINRAMGYIASGDHRK